MNAVDQSAENRQQRMSVTHRVSIYIGVNFSSRESFKYVNDNFLNFIYIE